MEKKLNRQTALITTVGTVLVVALLILGTIWTSRSAREDTIEAARSVSLLYLDELVGRREQVVRDFNEGNKGVVSFSYNGIQETLSYAPIDGTDWLLTYLVRDSVISERIAPVSEGIIRRSVLQSILTAAVLGLMFSYIIAQTRKNARLLLAEGNMINREIAELILTQMGFSVETAENGKLALDMVASSEPGYYDAVLMDIQMPVMDGYSAARAIRALDDKALAEIPILAMTANAFQEDVKAAMDAGMQAHIAKPVDVDKLTEALRSVLQPQP